ncbi:hypothetical protein E2C01_045383 [Portunus trituberculatus]|uniref:Uncharacterized protein n=1 Tax=Portunus trituberculatus TaxID=210409 RepID=A0A5B7G238_PORTR|nr:hypothetical protein [Portunus trituberculatus]
MIIKRECERLEQLQACTTTATPATIVGSKAAAGVTEQQRLEFAIMRSSSVFPIYFAKFLED